MTSLPEKLLQFIWANQLFHNTSLKTTEDERLHILYQGVLNSYSGPDFLNAQIKIGQTLFSGAVEIHVDESDWYTHKHHEDPAYNPVILHVVFNTGKPAIRHDKTSIPTLNLEGLLSKLMLSRYAKLMHAQNAIPCSDNFVPLTDLQHSHLVARMLLERLQSRSSWLLSYQSEHTASWQQLLYAIILRALGGTHNHEIFYQLSLKVPISMLVKHADQLKDLQAILYGTLRIEACDQATYNHYKRKYGMSEIDIPFIKATRPSATPEKKLNQFIHMINQDPHIIEKLLSQMSLKDIKGLLHSLSSDFKGLIILNAYLPFLYFMGEFMADYALQEFALNAYYELTAESNFITRKFQKMNLYPKNAADSQALLQLYKTYCTFKRCLDCPIGQSLLRLKLD